LERIVVVLTAAEVCSPLVVRLELLQRPLVVVLACPLVVPACPQVVVVAVGLVLVEEAVAPAVVSLLLGLGCLVLFVPFVVH
jgi:hypothetical protein